MDAETVQKWIRIKEDAFKAAGRTRYDKGSGFEAQYSLAYHKLALAGKRMKLKKKYRVG